MRLRLVEDQVRIAGMKKDEVSKLDRMDPEQVAAAVNNLIANGPPVLASFKDIIEESIRNYGFDTANNKLLAFIKHKKMKSTGANSVGKASIPSSFAKVLMQALQSGDVNLDDDFAQQWLWEKWAYDGDISKLNALILASDEKKVSKFGDPTTRIRLVGAGKEYRPNLRDARTKEDIAKVLDNWQTRDGSDGNARGAENAQTRDKNKIAKSDNDETRKAKIFNIFQDSYGLADKDVKATINTVYDNKKDLKTLFGIISAALAEKAGLTTVTN